ncbi:MAG: hypothetical protein KatS3mg038_0658 [Candidatus Kapaibacterium sp.]|nr:MAG: hypothetical protein KatS3mg038_0658 [Candidatus Kapabacteria bacterium]
MTLPALDLVPNVLTTLQAGCSTPPGCSEAQALFITAAAPGSVRSQSNLFAQLLAPQEADSTQSTPGEPDATDTSTEPGATQRSPGFAAGSAVPYPLLLVLPPILDERTAESTQRADVRPPQEVLIGASTKLQKFISNAVPDAQVEILSTSAPSSTVQIFHVELRAQQGAIALSPADDGSKAPWKDAPAATMFTPRKEGTENALLQRLVLHTHIAGADMPSPDGTLDHQQRWQPAESERSNAAVRDAAQHVFPLWSDDGLRQGLHSTPSGASPMTPFDGLRSVLRATVTTLTQSGTAIARIVLYPESLGTIVVHLQPQATGTVVEIIVSSAETLHAVEQTVEALRRDLAGSGVVAEAITVRMRDERPSSQQTVAPLAPLVAAIGDEHAERRRERRSFHQRQRQRRTHTMFDHFM